MRGTSGVAVGDGLGSREAPGDADGSTAKSGSLGSTGGAVSEGTHAPPSPTDANTSSAASRASTVRPATTSCGPITMTSESASAAIVAARPVIGATTFVAPTANSRQPRIRAWTTSSAVRTAGSNMRAATDAEFVVTAIRTMTSSRTAIGPPSRIAHLRRPAARWPRPGNRALSRRKRGARDAGSPAGRDGSDIDRKDAVDPGSPQPRAIWPTGLG